PVFRKEIHMDPMQNPEERYEGHPGSRENARSQAEKQFESGWEKTQEGMRSMKAQASESIESARQQLSETARRTLHQQKDRSVGGLKRLSSAIHEASHKLDEQGDHTLAEYTDL